MTVIPTLHVQPLYPCMGKGIIDYLGRYYLGAHITSDGGELALSLGTGSCQVGRP